MPPEMGNPIGRLMIIAGIALIIGGLLVSFGDRLPLGRLGRLPGDIVWKRGNFIAHFPLATSLLLSLLLTLLLWFINRK